MTSRRTIRRRSSPSCVSPTSWGPTSSRPSARTSPAPLSFGGGLRPAAAVRRGGRRHSLLGARDPKPDPRALQRRRCGQAAVERGHRGVRHTAAGSVADRHTRRCGSSRAHGPHRVPTRARGSVAFRPRCATPLAYPRPASTAATPQQEPSTASSRRPAPPQRREGTSFVHLRAGHRAISPTQSPGDRPGSSESTGPDLTARPRLSTAGAFYSASRC